MIESAGLVSVPIGTTHVVSEHAPPDELIHLLRGNDPRLVRRVIQDLNLEAIPRIVEPPSRFDQARGHGGLIVERELDGDEWKLFLAEAGHRLLVSFDFTAVLAA
jgi:hypothetical protein